MGLVDNSIGSKVPGGRTVQSVTPGLPSARGLGGNKSLSVTPNGHPATERAKAPSMDRGSGRGRRFGILG
jgi:hypothetical protein